jgi:hypothetical protein
MKTMNTKTIALLLAGMVVAGGLTSCKKKKEVVEKNVEGEVLIEQHCSGPEFFSNDKFFRANNLGESMDRSTSKKKAMANARADLASAITTTMRGVIDNYVNSREMNNQEEVEERFEGLTREVLDQQLVGTKTICEKMTQKTDGSGYVTYVAIELSGQDLLGKYHDRLSKDDRLKIDYDYEQFKETFNEEMNKLRDGN